MKRVRDRAIGEIVAGEAYWNGPCVRTYGFYHERQPGWTDFEYMLRRWYFYAWLSGDRVVEQHVHNLDVINWAIGSPPAQALAVGGRQWRVEPQFGNIYDPFGARYRYPNQAVVMSMARQINNIEGTRGCRRTAALRFRSASFGRSRAPRALHHRHQRRSLTPSGASR